MEIRTEQSEIKMDLRQLTYVVAVAEELNFTRAAARCQIVQSGLSYQIARLERELGQPLFLRTSRSVQLAPAGAALLPFARRALDQVAKGRDQVAALSGIVQGTLRLGLIPLNAGKLDLPALLGRYHERFPAVDVIVSDNGSQSMTALLLTGQLDAGFVGLFRDQVPNGLTHRLLAVEPLVAVVGDDHPLAARTSVHLKELAGASGFIDCHGDSGVRAQVDLAFARAGVGRHITFELGSLHDVARMAALGLGAAIVPTSVVDGVDDAGATHVLRLSDADALQPLALVFRDPPPTSPAARAFLELFRDSPPADFVPWSAARPSPPGG